MSLLSSADNFCKHFGPSGLIWIQTDTDLIIPEKIFRKSWFRKIQKMYGHTGRWSRKPKFRPDFVWASMQKNLSLGSCQYQMHRPACASAQSDQHLCYSLIGKYYLKTCYRRNFTFLACLQRGSAVAQW